MARRVLVVTYFFPPRPGSASLRLRGLAKYLHEFGWEPIVLTTNLPGKPDLKCRVIQTDYLGDIPAVWKKRFGLSGDRGLQEQIGIPREFIERRSTAISRMINLLNEILCYPDEKKLWLDFAVHEGSKLLAMEHIDAIISSYGPATCHLIAKELRLRFNIPWVADFRDLWTQNHYYPYSRFRRFFEMQLELKTLAVASALVSVSEPSAEDLRFLHKSKPVFVIPNGYDPDEVSTAPLSKQFTITYTGILYKGKRDPTPLFRAVRELIFEQKIDRRLVKIRLFGSKEYWVEEEVERFGLEDIVELHPFLSRDYVLEKQRESQVLLLILWDNPKERGVFTGKIFEYLAAKRPILAVGGPKGVVSELLEETRAGIHVLEYEQLKDTVLDYYNQYQRYNSVPYNGREDIIVKYSQREMAKRFAEVLDSLVAQNS